MLSHAEIVSLGKWVQACRPMRATSNNCFGLLLLIALFGVASAIRVFGISDIPMDFHPTKQFRSALTTRAYFYRDNASVEQWKKEVAEDNLKRIGVIVPTVQERVIAKIYSLSGEERLWIGRFFSSVFWLVGGLCVLAVGRRIASNESALLGTSLYLLAPFGVLASQSFQPDPPMIGACAAAIWLSVRYHVAPSSSRFTLAAAAAAVAIFLKPVAGFIVIPAFVGAGLGLRRAERPFRAVEALLLTVVALGPTIVFYYYRISLAGFDDWHRESSFFPGYMLEFPFWDGWLKRIRISMGFTYFFAGLLGACLARPGLARTLLASLWIGYFLMCFSLSYKISTHDYYHLPALLIGALSITQLTDPLFKVMSEVRAPGMWRFAAVITVINGLLLAAGTSVTARLRVPDFSTKVSLAMQIGQVVSHSRETIFLAPDYGRWLMYYGEMSGDAWPYWYDIRDEAIWSGTRHSTQERFDLMMRRGNSEYFVVADRDEYARQPELRKILVNYPVIFENADCLIYDVGVGGFAR